MYSYSLFFFNDTATTEIYTLSLHELFRSKIPNPRSPKGNDPQKLISACNKGAFCPLVVYDRPREICCRLSYSKLSKLSSKAVPLQIHFIDSSSWWSLSAPGDEFFDAIRSPFGDQLH